MNLSLHQINEKYADLLRLNPQNQKIYLVGGVVRDLVLEKNNKDIDILCELDARSIARRWADMKRGAFFVLDEERDTCRVIVTEVGGKSVFDFARQQGHSLQEDLLARDFTINAMAVDFDAPEILIDPLHGTEDLQKRILRVCSSDSFRSDPVRVIRAVRYSQAYHLAIEPETLKLLKNSVAALRVISGERKRDELFKILELNDPIPGLELLQENGILFELGFPRLSTQHFELGKSLVLLLECMGSQPPILPGDLLPGLEKLSNHFQEYLQSLRQKNSSGRNLRQLLLLSSVLGDLTLDGVRETALRLMLSNEEVERLLVILKYFNELSRLNDHLKMISDRELYLFFNRTDIVSLNICSMILARLVRDFPRKKNEEELKIALDFSIKIFDTWFDRQTTVVKPVPLLNGKDLMMIFDLAPGPTIGKLLDKLKEEQAAGVVTDRDQALIWMEEQVNEILDQRRWNKGEIPQTPG